LVGLGAFSILFFALNPREKLNRIFGFNLIFFPLKFQSWIFGTGITFCESESKK
jgi:hypothetical protein